LVTYWPSRTPTSPNWPASGNDRVVQVDLGKPQLCPRRFDLGLEAAAADVDRADVLAGDLARRLGLADLSLRLAQGSHGLVAFAH
jgi:hypothetical protein